MTKNKVSVVFIGGIVIILYYISVGNLEKGEKEIK